MLTRQNNPLNEVDFYIILLLNITVLISQHKTKRKQVFFSYFFLFFKLKLLSIKKTEVITILSLYTIN